VHVLIPDDDVMSSMKIFGCITRFVFFPLSPRLDAQFASVSTVDPWSRTRTKKALSLPHVADTPPQKEEEETI